MVWSWLQFVGWAYAIICKHQNMFLNKPIISLYCDWIFRHANGSQRKHNSLEMTTQGAQYAVQQNKQQIVGLTVYSHGSIVKHTIVCCCMRLALTPEHHLLCLLSNFQVMQSENAQASRAAMTMTTQTLYCHSLLLCHRTTYMCVFFFCLLVWFGFLGSLFWFFLHPNL